MTDDGGPAFPTEATVNRDDPKDFRSATLGMSLRDYFAAKAMQAQVATTGFCGLLCCLLERLHPERRDGLEALAKQLRENFNEESLAETSYAQAEAMLAESKRRNPRNGPRRGGSTKPKQ